MTDILRKTRNFAKFALTAVMSPLRKPIVGDAPWFDDGGKTLFAEHMASAAALLEYGCGGSTVYAASHGLKVISVETDARYAAAVNAKLSGLGFADKARVFHANIGLTRKWGYPLSDEPTAANIARWMEYTARPWREAKARGVRPDAVLVDGRFRVACVIRSLIEMEALGLEAPVLMDDYGGRTEYAPVLEVCRLARQSGRMAELRRKPGVSPERLRQALDASITMLR